MNILFVDPKSSTPYDGVSMQKEAIGGTEGSLVAIAEGLATNHRVAVEQLGRRMPEHSSPNLHYLPLNTEAPFGNQDADAVVILRSFRLVPIYRHRFPKAKLYVWIHNWQRPEVRVKRVFLARNKCEIIAVSDSLAKASESLINGMTARLIGSFCGGGKKIPISRIYNPVDCQTNFKPVAPELNRMIFFSTLNKGLRQVLEVYEAVRNAIPSMNLDLAGNSEKDLEQSIPGCSTKPGIRVLGRLPKKLLLTHVSKSLCVFYPQSEHPETFGLVFAEANAVGTPVLAHNFGAAAEVLRDPEQLVDANDHLMVINRLLSWQHNRPKVGIKSDFTLPNVLNCWHELLNSR